jgi:hypothetical protein
MKRHRRGRALRRRYGRQWQQGEGPRRVEVIEVDGPGGYWKVGQFGYVVGTNLDGKGRRYVVAVGLRAGNDRGMSAPGATAYLVSKSRGGRGGASWFAPSALRFTKQRGSR